VFAVVEQQQQFAIADRSRHAGSKIDAVRQLHIERRGDQTRQCAFIARGREVDPKHGLRLLAFATTAQFQRQLSLAGAAGPCQRQQTRCCGDDLQLGQVIVAPDQLDSSLWRRGAARGAVRTGDRSDPAIALGMNGLDVTWLQRIVAEQAPQFCNEPR